jgi:hypothetical protein
MFSIDRMEANRRIPSRMDQYGRWLPPRPIYGSLSKAGGTTGNIYYFNGTRVTKVDELPDTAEHYKTASIYHHGDLLWMIPYDATLRCVGTCILLSHFFSC